MRVLIINNKTRLCAICGKAHSLRLVKVLYIEGLITKGGLYGKQHRTL